MSVRQNDPHLNHLESFFRSWFPFGFLYRPGELESVELSSASKSKPIMRFLLSLPLARVNRRHHFTQ